MMLMLRRLFYGAICIVVLTLIFTVLNVVTTNKIAAVISSNFQIAEENFLHIGRIQTNFLSQMRLTQVSCNLTRYLFLSRLTIREILSDFNIFSFLYGNKDMLNRLTIISPKLVVQPGAFQEGVNRLIKDLSQSELTDKMEIHDGVLMFQFATGQPLFWVRDIWGQCEPGESGKYKFIFANHTGSESTNGFLAKGEISLENGEGETYLSLHNFDIGNMIGEQTHTNFVNMQVSADMMITGNHQQRHVDISKIKIQIGEAFLKGQGEIFTEDGVVKIDLSMDYVDEVYEGKVSLSGDMARPLVHGELWRLGSGVNRNKILFKGNVAYDKGLVLDKVKVEGGYGKIILDGVVKLSSASLDFLVREKFYNDIEIQGHMQAEMQPIVSDGILEKTAIKIYLSDLELNKSKMNDIFGDLEYGKKKLQVIEIRTDHTHLSGALDFEPDVPVAQLLFTSDQADLAQMKPVLMKGRGHAYLSGTVNGRLTGEGPWNALNGKGRFVIEEGSIGMISKFKKLILDFTWNGPILVMQDARIIRDKDYFILTKNIDLSRNDILASLEIEHVGETLEWEGWTINTPDSEVGLGIFGEFSRGMKASGGDEGEAPKSLLDLEYELKDGGELLFKIEQDESFMGVGKSIEF